MTGGESPHTAGATGKPGQGATFLPEDYVRQRVESRANVAMLLLFGVVLFGVTGAFFVTNSAWNGVRARQSAINEQYAQQTQKIEELKKLEAQKSAMLDKAETTASLLERVPRSILLAELTNRLPEKVTLTEVSLVSKRIVEKPKIEAKNDKAGAKKTLVKSGGKGEAEEPAPRPKPPRVEFTLAVNGLSVTDEAVADYQAALKKCGLLDRVDLVSSQEATAEGQPVRRFRLEARISSTADARSIEPLRMARTVKPGSLGARAAIKLESSVPGPGAVDRSAPGGMAGYVEPNEAP